MGSMFDCPRCRARLMVTFHTDQDAGGWRSLTPLADAAGPGWLRDVARSPTFTEAHRTSPARPASTESDVVVPLLQSLITGVIVGLPAGTFVALVCQWPWWSAPAIAVGVIIPAVWLHRLGAHTRALWTVERVIGRDLDGDRQVGPLPVHLEATITDRRRGHSTVWRTQFPGEARFLRRFAAAVDAGTCTFSERDAVVCGYTQFEALRDQFLLNGWADWRNQAEHRQGVELTEAGEQLLAQMAATPLPPA